jgi:hypothetical protein
MPQAAWTPRERVLEPLRFTADGAHLPMDFLECTAGIHADSVAHGRLSQ